MLFFAITTVVGIVVVAIGFAALKNVKDNSVWLPAVRRDTHPPINKINSLRETANETAGELSAPTRDLSWTHQDLWAGKDYFWVVVCKNDAFHRHPNLYNVHRIPLGETDALISNPPVREPFLVRCDECGKDYVYKPLEVLRYEMEVSTPYVPHPLFRN